MRQRHLPPTPAAAAPPPAAPAAPATPASSGQYDFDQAKSTLQGAHKYDLGIMGAGLVAFLAGFMPFYSASAGIAGHSISVHASAWHGFFGWFAVLVALAAAVLVALEVFNVKLGLPMPLHQSSQASSGSRSLCLILALFVVPVAAPAAASSAFGATEPGHGFGYWLALLCVPRPGLSLMRSCATTALSRRTPPERSSTIHDGRRPIRSAPVALLICPVVRPGRTPRRVTHVVRRRNAKPSCHGWSVAALVQRRWRPLCVPMK